MAQAGAIRRIVIPVLCIVVTALGLNNVYGDSTAVEALAEQTACGAKDCAVKLVGEQKTPFSHTYTFQTSVRNMASVAVECSREYWLVGEYHCAQK